MLSVNINRDIEQYREPVAFGMDAKQTIAAIRAIIAVMGLVCLFRFVCGMSIELSIYLSLPVCVPIMLPALGKKHGLTVMDQFRGNNKRKNVLAYEAKMPIERKEMQKDGGKTEKRRTKTDKKAEKNTKTRSVSENKE